MTTAEERAPIRGSEAVQAALIQAAGELLGEVGPQRVSVREVADRAGVNHGQVHHYFGGKRGLLKAAMADLARRHFSRARELSGGSVFPPALSLAEDRPYSRALCQSIMEGDLELASIELEEDVSPPRHILRALQTRDSTIEHDVDLKARLAIVAAMQLGWAAFEDFIVLITDLDDQDRNALRTRVKKLMGEMIDDFRR